MSAPLGYYPGCSQSGTAAEYDISTRACCKALGIELADVPDWTCCGSTPAHTVDHHLAGALSARNLLQAQAAGFDRVITPCPSCLSALKTADAHLAHETYRAKVEHLLGRPGPGPVNCQSVLQVLFEQIGPGGVKAKVTRPLTGLRVAPYYGCIMNRPPGLMNFDDPENPMAMDALLSACGAEVVDFPFKTECCGAAFGMPRLDVMQRLSARILDMARSCGADAIVVACPLCQMNLDLRRGQVNSASGQDITMPVPYFTQLLGLALGLPDADLALGKLVLPLAPALIAAKEREAQREAHREGERAAKEAVKAGHRPAPQPVCEEDAPCA
ncbi:MAG: CoB--CoM heterodisulfide reductase iron-sulfur subunit B family protein [Humidesulfovibrio sp.]|uniref:CoB--CoM heterodisulfide reductase iron-sulfur subunit B family protein n=1 Tax=Humidesulfovibrio sp. TaxID=2910988 RepID=UPI002734AAA6|nr:CoB--CoM heterodisulfide reductase iron-sulfur subunit B family protein [Humidesulfovibrio sp.]MDP2847108.1 CoB--CoM heterodisulfide reductase iron-sulfur subunit B family protein [Humidesulfovibrio sp.]